MFTTTFAAISAFQMEFLRENLVSLLVVVKVLVFFDVVLCHKLKKDHHFFYICSMIIVCQRLLKNTKINGITLYPFILLKKPEYKENCELINHEKIHLRQQLELLIVFFYIWYVVEYYYWYFKLKDSFLAYRYISFEREAYAKESDLIYLKNRKLWSFWKYLANS